MALQEATSPKLFVLNFGTAQDTNDPPQCGRPIRATAYGTIEKFYLPDSIDKLESRDLPDYYSVLNTSYFTYSCSEMIQRYDRIVVIAKKVKVSLLKKVRM